MKITFLGTGTSTGVPHLLCDCEVCQSSDPHDKRLRSSVFIEIGDTKILIDCGPDFRQQMLKYNLPAPDVILITHGHKDHISGLDENRQIQGVTHKETIVYADEIATKAIKHDFFYAFAEVKYPGVPSFDMRLIDDKAFSINGITIQPIPILHYQLPILGFRIGKFAYITDASHISDESIEKLRDLDVLVLNCLGDRKHFAHFNLEQALEAISRITPKAAYLTHMGHRIGLYRETSKILPPNINLAYDGLSLSVDFGSL